MKSTETRSRPSGSRKKSLRDRLRPETDVPTKHGYFRSFDGTKLFYSVEGEGKPLVFCYGLVCSSLHWTYQIEHFRKNYRTIWMDYRGHQNSDVPEDLGSLNLESLAKDLKLLLDELKVADAVLLGHSMGVNVVLEFARLFPERVAGMVLSNGTVNRPLETLLNSNALVPGFRALEFLRDKSPKLLNKIWTLQKGNPLVHRTIGMLGFNPHLTAKEDVALYVDQIADMDPRVFLSLIRNYDRYDGSTWLHTIKAPTRILAGEDDYIIPLAQQELLHQLIAGSELEIIRHGSHCPQMDLPDLVNSKIEEFLRRISY
ncbi:MAG: alpha/beta hydrolase [Bdellovibrionales bacterium]|nr:alpha/beta hydrolase [Bdellovibrionales bacterium]